jgi:hypothetical protein
MSATVAALDKYLNLSTDIGLSAAMVYLKSHSTYGWERSLCVRRLTASLRAMAGNNLVQITMHPLAEYALLLRQSS